MCVCMCVCVARMPPPVEPEKAITMAEKRKRLYKSRMKNHTYKWRASMPISFQQVMHDPKP
jgi:hypothetical protein